MNASKAIDAVVDLLFVCCQRIIDILLQFHDH